MPDLFLSNPNPAGPKPQIMDLALAEHCLDLVAHEASNYVHIHLDWTNPPDYLPRLGRYLEDKGVAAVFSIGPDAPRAKWEHLQKAGFKICLEISPEAAPLQMRPEWLDIEYACLYISRPGQDIPAGLIAAMPGLEALFIAPGWSDALSGPAGLGPPADCGDWAAALPRIAARLARYGLTFSFKCGIPLCMFELEQLGSLAGIRIKWPMATCPLDLMILPDGRVHPCQRLESDQPVYAAEYEDMASLRRAVSGRYQRLQSWCQYDPDMSCRSQKTRACQGGCLALQKDAWRRGKA